MHPDSWMWGNLRDVQSVILQAKANTLEINFCHLILDVEISESLNEAL